MENDETNTNKCNTIKSIEGLFKALATDIVANEGKEIFCAKNRLGMTDKAVNTIIEIPLVPITGMIVN